MLLGYQPRPEAKEQGDRSDGKLNGHALASGKQSVGRLSFVVCGRLTDEAV